MKYLNPVLRGFYPDPSICRVNEDYYLVTSSFEYFPGIPLFHSRDLVNWEQIGNCINRTSQLSLEHAKDSGGIWAPTLRYWEGVFYVTATLDNFGNFIISSNDITKEWSDPVWVSMGGIDPSLYFEDSKAYYCTNYSMHAGKEEISLAEIDIQTGELESEIKGIWSGTGGGYLEAPHIYHIDNWYYLLVAEGGSSFNHMVTIARSRSIGGEYESCPFNPILTNRNDTSKEVQCAGHGDIIEDHNGNWWMMHLGIRLSRRTMSHLGRETFLTPLKWENEWPVVNNNSMAKLENDGPLWDKQKERKGLIADFNQEEWEPEWIFLRNPRKDSYERGQGKLKIYPTPITFREAKSPTFLAVRQRDFTCEVEAECKFNPCQVGDEAGIAIVLSSEFYYCIGKRRTLEGDFLVVEKNAEDFQQVAYQVPIKDGKFRLKVQADDKFYTFYYSIGEMSFQELGKASTRFLSCEIAGKCFTGVVIGLYAVSMKETNSLMEIMEFKMK